ncbi:reticulon-3 isoform X1 [Hoplias malabaricus]|uniref:reticulon-3 isoform X1 n=1 Tax=Hoplias malabaricus TaxID=27720 RepID=UPI00346384AC
MADPMTQSSQISSSQGLKDGHSATAKDSKFSDSFFSSSPVSLIQSPQDKKVVLGSDKPSEIVATSLCFSSQPSSFPPVTYGNESSGPPAGQTDSSFQDKREIFESGGSQKQDDSPIKVSPVSERIKALEALAAKHNDSDWSDGGFPHFRERHYEKSPTDTHGVSSSSSFKKRAASTEQDSPESPFEVLGDARCGSDFEDTADWMRAHLPPAPDFSTEESDFNEIKESVIMQESPSKQVKASCAKALDVSESFVGVPDEFMDTPAEVGKQKYDSKQSKQKIVEDESEFDLRFLPTAYMWNKQEKSDNDAQDASCLSETQDSEIPVSPAPPDGFESSSMPSPAPVPQVDLSAKQKSTLLSGGSAPPEIHEIDSSGESDDTVIEDASGAGQCAITDDLEFGPCVEMSLKDEQGKQSIQVPIINVIETEEQNISDDEMELEEEEEDGVKYQVMQESVRELPKSSDEHSEDAKSEDFPLKGEEISIQTNVSEYSPKCEIIKDVDSEDTFNQTCVELKDPNFEDLTILQNMDHQKESYINSVKLDQTAENALDLLPTYEGLSNEIECSDIDTYLDHYTSQELALKDQLNSGVFSENDGESHGLQKSVSLEHNKHNTLFDQQSIGEEAVDETYETVDENKLENDDVGCESSLAGISTDTYVEPLPPKDEKPSPDLEDTGVHLEEQKRITAPGNYSLMEENNYIIQNTEELPSVQENTPAPFPSFHNDESGKISEVIYEFVSSDVTGLVMTNSGHGDPVQHDVPDLQMLPETTSKPESIEPECSETAATDSFVEFMRECLKSQQVEQPENLGIGHIDKYLMSVAPSSPTMIMDLEQERLTISALKEIGSSQEEEEEEEDEINVSIKVTSVSSKDASEPRSKVESPAAPISTPQQLPNEYQPEASLAREVDAIDIWVAEAYHLAEHVLAAILTHLSVSELVHWRDPKKSGVVFGTSLLLLLSLAAFSVISIISYLLLALLCVTITFRIYKSVIQAVQKSNEGHPFKTLMEKDVSVPPEIFRRHVDTFLTYINCALKQMCRLFLVEDLVDSLKLAVVMWLLTYVGAVFNGITILILADILMFSVPPLYEKNKTQIDHYIDIARTQINTTVAKLQEKLPGAVKRSKTE